MKKEENKLRQQVLSELFIPKLGKAERTQCAIIEAAIRCYVSAGLESTNYQKIAEVGGISRSLIQHYFPQPIDLLLMAVKFVRGNFQNFAIQAVMSKSGPHAQLVAYVRSTFAWGDQYLTHGKFWLLFYYYSSADKRFKAINNELVKMGQERIIHLLEAGKKIGIFHCTDSTLAAKWIQTLITGALVTTGTEDLSLDLKLFEEQTVERCLKEAGFTA